MNKKLYLGLSCVIFFIILYIYWNYIRPGYYKSLYQKLKQFKGDKHSHSTNQLEEEPQLKPIRYTNRHMLIYGTSGSSKTFFLKFHSDQRKSMFVVFGRDETEFPDNYVPLSQLENINIESLANKTTILDDAGAYSTRSIR